MDIGDIYLRKVITDGQPPRYFLLRRGYKSTDIEIQDSFELPYDITLARNEVVCIPSFNAMCAWVMGGYTKEDLFGDPKSEWITDPADCAIGDMFEIVEACLPEAIGCVVVKVRDGWLTLGDPSGKVSRVLAQFSLWKISPGDQVLITIE